MATSRISLAKSILLLLLVTMAFHSISVADAGKDCDGKLSKGENDDGKSDKISNVNNSEDSDKKSKDEKDDNDSEKPSKKKKDDGDNEKSTKKKKGDEDSKKSEDSDKRSKGEKDDNDSEKSSKKKKDGGDNEKSSKKKKGDEDSKKSEDSDKRSKGEKDDNNSEKSSKKKKDDGDNEKSSKKKKGDDDSEKSSKDKKNDDGDKSEAGSNGEKPEGRSEGTSTEGSAPTVPTSGGGSTGGSTGVKSDGSEKVFSVLDFGAKADGKTDNAASFVKAWRAACDCGKARMVIPKGEFVAAEMVFTGPCKGPVVVEFAGTLKAKPDPGSYSEDTWMLFQSVTGMLVTGGGVIDGQGPLVWKHNSGGGSLPASIKFIDSKDLEINQIHSVNAMGFHLSIVLCANVKIANVKIEAPDESPNTDGIHISQTSKMDIVDSIIGTGDDCVGIIQGSSVITVNNVVCGPGHGLSIGSLGKHENEKDVSGISITNCTLKGTDNGLRIKTFAGSPPSACTGVTFRDIIMENVKNPIIIDQSYGKKSNAPSKVQVSDVKFINVKGTSRSEVGVLIDCSKDVPCQGVQLSNIDLQFNEGKGITSECVNAKIQYSGQQSPAACK